MLQVGGMRDYHRLEIWRRAHALAMRIHRIARGFRGREFASLRAQLTRAADSIAANIVEGCAAESNPEFARFLSISIKSTAETEYHLLSARDQDALDDEKWLPLSNEAVEIRRMTYAYRRSLLDEKD
ncbi:MAG TPA: four helix bundle protein [Gemmatimonadaceae bacterium]